MPLWKREEIQKMPRFLSIGFLLAAVGTALPGYCAILPDSWANAKAVPASVKPVRLEDRALADELSFEAGEEATYQSPAGTFTVTAWRFKDPTSALVWYLAARPASAKPGPAAYAKEEPVASATTGGVLVEHGNYILRFAGITPTLEQLRALYGAVPKFDRSALPVLPAYLPAQELVANSERYFLGPVSLERWEGRLSAGTVAFSMGAEGITAKYDGDASLSIFNYPTPEMARQRADEFRKVAGAMVKRTGPLVAVLLGAATPDQGERLLAKVNYQATLTWNEPDPDATVRSAGKMMVSIFELAGLLGGLAVATGIMFGLLRYARRRMSPTSVDEPMITLDLSK